MLRPAFLPIVVALAVVACDRKSGDPSPASAATPVAPDLVDRPAPRSGSTPAAPSASILTDLRRWDEATTEARRAAAEDVERRASGFKLLRLETFTCGYATHEVAIYLHDRTGMEFVLVPAGKFEMGTPENQRPYDWVETLHKVTLTEPFLIARTETTCGAWTRVMGPDPPKTAGTPRPQFPTNEWPMVSITWDEAAEFCSAAGLVLPTEAQWEYACRAGVDQAFCSGEDIDELDGYAWFDRNSGSDLHAVAGKRPNAFGLFDMHGNVGEFCDGWWVKDQAVTPVVDPVSPPTGTDRIRRGGCYASPAWDTRSAHRDWTPPQTYYPQWGFRPIGRIPAK